MAASSHSLKMMMGMHMAWPRDHESGKDLKLERESAARVWRFARPYRAQVTGFLASVIFQAVLGLVPALLFGRIIFSTHPIAKFMPSAATTFIVLVSSSTTDGANFFDNFVARLGLILLTLLYIVVAVSIIDRYWPRLSSRPA